MAERTKGCVVAFDRDLNEEDTKRVLNAISMIKGVIGVAGENRSPSDYMNRVRVFSAFEEIFFKALKEAREEF